MLCNNNKKDNIYNSKRILLTIYQQHTYGGQNTLASLSKTLPEEEKGKIEETSHVAHLWQQHLP